MLARPRDKPILISLQHFISKDKHFRTEREMGVFLEYSSKINMHIKPIQIQNHKRIIW